MTPQKPKGCFQCSKRRIVCDLGEPHCRKCIQKGLECSGLGRIRFVPGVASRGKFKNSRIPAIQATSKEHQKVQTDDGSSSAVVLSVRPGPPRTQGTQHDQYDTGSESPSAQEVDMLFGSPIARRNKRDESISVAILQRAAEQLSQSTHPRPQAWLPPVGHHARMLLSHCNDCLSVQLITSIP